MVNLSVIIPIYNVAEEYLRECLNSMTSQTYKKTEFIVVIDGSTDRTPEICIEFADTDPRFKLFRRKNCGAGASRNFGLDKATGDYVMFMDSDDYWLDDGLLESVARLLSESHADILSFSYKEFYNNDNRPTVPIPANLPRKYILNQDDALECLLKAPRNTFSSSIITKVIKLSLIREHDIRFIEGVNCEDAHFTAQLIYYAKSYDRLNECVYAVRRHRGSTSRSRNADDRILRSMLTVFDDLSERFKLHETRNSPVLDFLASPYLYILGKASALENSKPYQGRLKEYSFLLMQSSRLYVRAVGIAMRVFGLPFTLAVLHGFLLLNQRSVVSINKTMKGRK